MHSTALYAIQIATVKAAGWNGNTITYLTTGAKAELHWWAKFLTLQRHRKTNAAFRTAELSVTATDASDHSVAGLLLSTQISHRSAEDYRDGNEATTSTTRNC